MCCGPATSARILGFLSVIIAIGLVGTSAWVFKEYYELHENSAVKAGGAITKTVDTLFGTNTSKVLPKRINIFLYCSGVTLAVGGLQILTSIFLLISGGGKSRAPGCTYSLVNTVGLFAVISAVVCIVYQEYFDFKNYDRNQDYEQYWMGMMIADVVFYLVGSCIAGCFTRNN